MPRILTQEEENAILQGPGAQPKQVEGLLADLLPINQINRLVGGAVGSLKGNPTMFLSSQDAKNYQDPLNIAKDLASYFAPAIAPVSIPGMIAAGAAQGFGNSYGDSSLAGTLGSTFTGAGLAGGLGLGGKAISGLGNKLTKPLAGEGTGFLSRQGKKLIGFAENQDAGAFQRNIGAKIPNSLGGQTLFPKFKQLGLTAAKDADELMTMADDVLAAQGERIMPALQGASSSGVSINAKDFLAPLENSLKKTTLPSQRQVIEATIADIKGAIGNKAVIDPQDMYRVKQALGEIRGFKFGDDIAEATKKGIYEKAYFQADDLLDQALKKSGFDDFKLINKDLTTALNAKAYARRVDTQAMAGRPLNLLDLVTSVGGAAAGGPAGMAGAALTSKVLQSPRTEKLIAGGARGIGEFLQGKGGPNLQGVGNVLNRGGDFLRGSKVPYLATSLAPQASMALASGPEGQYATDPQIMADMNGSQIYSDMVGGGQSEQQAQAAQIFAARDDLAKQLYLTESPSGKPYTAEAAIKEADNLMRIMYGVDVPSQDDLKGGGGKKLTEGEKKFSAAGAQALEALKLLESGGVSTGKIASVGNSISSFLGTQSAKQTDYRSKLAAARGSAVSALSGANVPESEYARIAALIPEETDEPDIASQKLRSFVQAMQVYSSQ